MQLECKPCSHIVQLRLNLNVRDIEQLDQRYRDRISLPQHQINRRNKRAHQRIQNHLETLRIDIDLRPRIRLNHIILYLHVLNLHQLNIPVNIVLCVGLKSCTDQHRRVESCGVGAQTCEHAFRDVVVFGVVLGIVHDEVEVY